MAVNDNSSCRHVVRCANQLHTTYHRGRKTGVFLMRNTVIAFYVVDSEAAGQSEAHTETAGLDGRYIIGTVPGPSMYSASALSDDSVAENHRRGHKLYPGDCSGICAACVDVFYSK